LLIEDVFLLFFIFLLIIFLVITGGIIFDAHGIISCCHLFNFIDGVNLFCSKIEDEFTLNFFAIESIVSHSKTI
jgi:hypothetical protein